ncbi:MAG: patatin family protein [Propioniciclava sp.]|uniref:patatin-like phospholipase family protein n=1 Tax=Propioniciclava sp. TaxID=2038686 RepID=UPI0039E44E2D
MASTPEAPAPAPLRVNAPGVALIFEGGGMRAAYTSAVAVRLIESGIVFPFVAGISAGCTNTINYLSSDVWRAKTAVTTFAGDPQFGNWRTFLRGQGLFNSDYIYRRTSRPGEALPLNFDAFGAHPGEVSMTAFRTRDGATVRWGRADMPDLEALSVRAQASSTMPVIMPPVTIDGETYVDGALCTTGGIAIDAAREAGYRRFFVVLTQERGYRKKPPSNPWFFRRHFRETPAVADALNDRWQRYNATREELFDLESSGEAYLFVPETMAIGNGERSVPRLLAAHARGLNQATRELPRWREFLGL